ncbi:MAG: serine/threonine protein kinase [Deltaproteobacteria bacterium]|nr:serine/threonine protein kinase [Deltaproteobacteria bacterium]
MPDTAPALDATVQDAHTDTLVRGVQDAPGAIPTMVLPSPRSTVLPVVKDPGSEAPTFLHEPRERYEARKPLGEGGIGEVTLAHDQDIDRPVALKRLKPEMVGPSSLVRFIDEIRIVGRLDHPNIVPVHDVGVDADRRLFYVMKYVEGETLEKVLERLLAGDPEYHRRYTFARRVQVFLGVLRAVDYAHSRGVIHRDLKPANVMLGTHGEVTVMDWGIARDQRARASITVGSVGVGTPGAPSALVSDGSLDATLSLGRTTAGSLVGTPHYMSPEQARGENDKVDARSDTYALAVLLHEFLTLKHYLDDVNTLPAVLDGVQSRAAPFENPVHPLQGTVPVELLHFVHRGMRKDPEARFASVAEMILAIERIQSGRVEVHCPVTMVKRMGYEFGHMTERFPTLMVLGLVAVPALAVVGLVGLLLRLL